MKTITYRQAKHSDIELLIELYNKSFYSDFIKYGECPAYGRSYDRMEESLNKIPKEIILYDDIPVGVISLENRKKGRYYIGCLCVIPEYQNMGIGTEAINHITNICEDWENIELITPADKNENIHFYKKCGFEITDTKMDGNVKVVKLEMNR